MIAIAELPQRGWRGLAPAPRPYLGGHGDPSPDGRPARRAARPDAHSCASAAASRCIGAALAVLVTIIIVIIFLVDSKINTAPPPQIVYVENYAANRTDAEIIADQKKDQAEERRKAEEAQPQGIPEAREAARH